MVPKERGYVKKGVILKAVSIFFAVVAILAIACAATVTGSGFLDLSSIARAAFVGAAMICGILSAAIWKRSKPKA